ncbi:MAG: hypothetical protein ACI89J_002077 [Hyphomicrobiaceae bacterium]|jgi:hypothetical protein
MPETPTKPPSTNPTLATEDPEAGGFLQRWSQRKVDAAAPTEPQSPTQTAALDAEDAALPHATDGEATDGPQSGEQAADAPPPVTEADLENLTYQSDYTKFMGEHVPEAIRRRALHQLWRSDPILANLDGLCDYDDDFTDAALAVKVLKTAHKVGQGYLTDEEVSANRARGKPPEAVAEDKVTEDDGEDMEDFDDDGDTDDVEVTAADQDPDATPDPEMESAETDADEIVADPDKSPQTETS